MDVIVFYKLPNEILDVICSYLNIRDERILAGLFSNVNEVSQENTQKRLAKILNNPTPIIFSQLLSCIIENEKVGFALIKNEACKNILLTQKPKSLPSWILSIGESQPNLLQYIMEEKDYRDSLSKLETEYIITQYKNLLSPELIQVINRELTSKEDKLFEEDLSEEESSPQLFVS